MPKLNQRGDRKKSLIFQEISGTVFMTTGLSDINILDLHVERAALTGNRSIREAPATAGEIAIVPVDLLSPGDSPRLEGHSAEHVARLAESDTPLPPILVQRRGMRVIDGMHRLMAAIVKGCETIEVEFFDGTEADAFLRGVQANVSHGLPLTLPDRRAAAERIIRSHPNLSNRAIAEATGLGRTSVAGLRQRIEPAYESGLRIGKDGRLRPVDSAEGRYRAAQYIEENPQASLREVGKFAGIALGTASDVRRRLLRGEQVLPPAAVKDAVATGEPDARSTSDGICLDLVSGAQYLGDAVDADDLPQPEAIVADAARESGIARRWLKRRSADRNSVDPEALLIKLLRDPSLRYSDAGRQLLKTLRSNAVISHDRRGLVAALPPHCEVLVRQLAEHYAQMWEDLARELAMLEGTAPSAGPRVAS